MSDFPSFEELVAERLQLILATVEGIKGTSKTQPERVIMYEEMPFAYTLFGPTFPTESTTGTLSVGRTYFVRVLIRPLGTGVDEITDGAEANLDALPLFSRIRWTFVNNDRLRYDSQPLRYFHGWGGEIQDTGLLRRAAAGYPNGVASVEFDLPIIMRAKTGR